MISEKTVSEKGKKAEASERTAGLGRKERNSIIPGKGSRVKKKDKVTPKQKPEPSRGQERWLVFKTEKRRAKGGKPQTCIGRGGSRENR